MTRDWLLKRDHVLRARSTKRAGLPYPHSVRVANLPRPILPSEFVPCEQTNERFIRLGKVRW